MAGSERDDSTTQAPGRASEEAVPVAHAVPFVGNIHAASCPPRRKRVLTMSILLKSPEEIAKLRDAGRIVAETYEELRPHVVPGVTTGELDAIAERYVRKAGAFPIYKGYGAMHDRRGRLVRVPFPATIWVAANDGVCDGFPNSKQELHEGDIIGVDIGVLYKGWVGDSCVTYAVGKVDADTQRLLDVTRRSMELGIEQAEPGKHLGDIGAAIQHYAETN